MMGAAKGAMNAWGCGNHVTMTIHADAGTTPMWLACQEAGCSKTAMSFFYPNQKQIPADYVQLLTVAGWEWYRPNDSELAMMPREVAAHVHNGGLLLRSLRRPWARYVQDYPERRYGIVGVDGKEVFVDAVRAEEFWDVRISRTDHAEGTSLAESRGSHEAITQSDS